jgi:hypothetical protein
LQCIRHILEAFSFNQRDRQVLLRAQLGRCPEGGPAVQHRGLLGAHRQKTRVGRLPQRRRLVPRPGLPAGAGDLPMTCPYASRSVDATHGRRYTDAITT